MLKDIEPMTYTYLGQTLETMRQDNAEIPLNPILLVMVFTTTVVVAMQVF